MKFGKIFGTFLIGLVAFSVAGLVAYISVSGLGKLYAGSILVIALAGALEIGKLIAASFLHNYWSKINWLIKSYLIIAVVVLMGITSTGIYGYLSAANQQTVDELLIQDSQIEILDLKKERFNEQLTTLNDEKGTLTTSIVNYSQGLSNNVIQYTDTSGQIITTTSSSTRRVLERQLDDAKQQRDIVSKRIEALSDSVTNLDIQVLETKKNSDVAVEVGPLKFIAKITGLPMETVTNYLSLLLIFVGDPFAVIMVLVLNTKIKIDKGDVIKKEIKENSLEMYGDSDKAKSTLRSIMDKFKNKKKDDGVNDGVNDGVTESVNDGVDSDIFPLTESYMDGAVAESIESSDEGINEGLSKGITDEPKKDIDDLYKEYKSKKEETSKPSETDELSSIEQHNIHTHEEHVLHEAIKHRGNIMGHPYYEHPKFNWKLYKNVWRNDPNAIQYWLSKKKDKGDDDFTTKTY